MLKVLKQRLKSKVVRGTIIGGFAGLLKAIDVSDRQPLTITILILGYFTAIAIAMNDPTNAGGF